MYSPISGIVKPGDQALILISTILKFSAQGAYRLSSLFQIFIVALSVSIVSSFSKFYKLPQTFPGVTWVATNFVFLSSLLLLLLSFLKDRPSVFFSFRTVHYISSFWVSKDFSIFYYKQKELSLWHKLWF